MGVRDTIRRAEALLPGRPRKNDDPRWQAIIEVGQYITTNPNSVWRFICKWGNHKQDDLRSAIACVLLEHLLEYNFAAYFPEVEKQALKDKLFADTFLRCWKLGVERNERRSKQWDKLVKRLHAE